MKCLASLPRRKDKQMKREIVNNALETVFVTVSYVLITQFKMSVSTAKKILEKVEYYALILIDDEEELTIQDYEEILQQDYNFALDLTKVKYMQATSKGEFVTNTAIKNSLDFVLTIVAYVLFDKVGLKQERVQTIMKRVIYYVNAGLNSPDAVERLKTQLKDNYDCSFGFHR